MDITLRTPDTGIPDDVRRLALAKLSRGQRRYARFDEMEVAFSEAAHARAMERVRCDVVLNGRTTQLRASATGPDHLSALDRVQDKLSRQARKLKTRRVLRPRRTEPATPAASDV